MTHFEFRKSIKDKLNDIAEFNKMEIGADGNLIVQELDSVSVNYEQAISIANMVIKEHLAYLLEQMKEHGLSVTGFSIAVATIDETENMIDVTHYCSGTPVVFKAIVDTINRRYYKNL